MAAHLAIVDGNYDKWLAICCSWLFRSCVSVLDLRCDILLGVQKEMLNFFWIYVWTLDSTKNSVYINSRLHDKKPVSQRVGGRGFLLRFCYPLSKCCQIGKCISAWSWEKKNPVGTAKRNSTWMHTLFHKETINAACHSRSRTAVRRKRPCLARSHPIVLHDNTRYHTSHSLKGWKILEHTFFHICQIWVHVIVFLPRRWMNP